MPDPYATHQRLLTKYLIRTTGPIVELGCGDYSTPIIHEIAAAQGRTVRTLESDAGWLNKFADMKTEWHTMEHVASWDAVEYSGRIGLAFIDQTPGHTRPIEFMKLREVADVLILHDTEATEYNWRSAYRAFDHIETDAAQRPSTTVLRGTNPSTHIATEDTTWRNCWADGVRFLVVVPTHRLSVAQGTIDTLERSLTYPTDFRVLDGSLGKCHAINHALTDILDPRCHDIYCTVDDDLILADNWQHFIACALARVPQLGVVSIDYRGSAIGEDLMSAAIHAPIHRIADVEFRDCTGIQNVAGGCMAMPSGLAKTIGPFPHADDGRIYHLEEDAWRCHQATVRGYRIGYVSNPNGVTQILQHETTAEYRQKKQSDIEEWKQNPAWDR